MRLHQILTGSYNGNVSHVSCGRINETTFIVIFCAHLMSLLQAYASGCDVVLLNENLFGIQVIPGRYFNDSIITAVSSSDLNGKASLNTSHKLHDYRLR